MIKKHFIALADAIKEFNNREGRSGYFTLEQQAVLAHFCQSQNPNFNRNCWLDYIEGKCGKNGGSNQALVFAHRAPTFDP